MFVFSHLGTSLIVLKQILILMPSWPRTCNWIFFLRLKIFKSSGVPIGLLTPKHSLCQIVRNIMKTLHASFEWFSLIGLSARLNFVKIWLKITLNPYEFWRAFSYPTSDDHLPTGYSRPDFQLIWSINFKWTSNLSIPIIVLTHKNCFVCYFSFR